MAIDKGFERTSEANLTDLIGNLFAPAAFFKFKDFNIFPFTLSKVTKKLREKSRTEQDLELTADLILVAVNILCRIFLLVLSEFSNSIFSGFKPLDHSAVLM